MFWLFYCRWCLKIDMFGGNPISSFLLYILLDYWACYACCFIRSLLVLYLKYIFKCKIKYIIYLQWEQFQWESPLLCSWNKGFSVLYSLVSVVPVWMNTALLGWLQQPLLWPVTVKLYISPQSRPENWQLEVTESHVFSSPPDALMALAVYSSTLDLSSQDRTAVRELHCRLTATLWGGQGPEEDVYVCFIVSKWNQQQPCMHITCKSSLTCGKVRQCLCAEAALVVAGVDAETVGFPTA